MNKNEKKQKTMFNNMIERNIEDKGMSPGVDDE